MTSVTKAARFPLIPVMIAVVIRPTLWWTAVRQLVRMTPKGWWRTAPFLPVPPADYLEFRLTTQYGGDGSTAASHVTTADVVDYLRWCRSWNDGR